MKQVLVALTAAASLAFGIIGVEAAVNPAQLTRAGWTCEFVAGAVHCGHPGDAASGVSVQFLVFEGSDPTSATADFLGTEQLISADVFADQPCPQDGGTYTLIPFLNLYFCHHYDQSF